MDARSFVSYLYFGTIAEFCNQPEMRVFLGSYFTVLIHVNDLNVDKWLCSSVKPANDLCNLTAHICMAKPALID